VTDHTCRVSTCDRPTDAFACVPCGAALEQALSETPWVVEQLNLVAAKQARYGDGIGGKSIGKSQPLPYDVRASEALTKYHALLTSWVKMLQEENPHWRLPKGDTAAMSRWLMFRLNEIRHHEAGGDCVDEITSTFAFAKYAVDRPAERRYAGPCECGKDLYHRPGAIEVSCRECERTYDVGELYSWMQRQVLGRLVTAREGATLLSRFDLETQQGTIDKWHERKLITPHGTNRRGHRLYLFDDLLDLATRHAKRPA
jgi:hypothetical protein